MKARLTTLLCVITLALAGITQASAQDKPSTVVKAVDAVVVRPICFASTVVGTTFFLISLPVTAAIKQTKPVADSLVVRPAKATFKRPLGDIDAMAD